MNAKLALWLLVPLAAPCGAPDELQEPAPAPAASEAPSECAYLARRKLKLAPERGALARADALLARGRTYRERGIGGESLVTFRSAEELFFAGFDGALWTPDAARFSLARGETARTMKLPKEALACYARAVVLAGELPEGERAPGEAELDELLLELDAPHERDAVLAAARADLTEREHAELLRGTVDRPAPALELERVGGGSFSTTTALGRVALYWFWSPRDAAGRAGFERVLELAARWSARQDVLLIGVLLPDESELDEAARQALERAAEAFPQVRADADAAEAFLVLGRPAAALVDARGSFRYASSGASPFTVDALERAALGLASEAAAPAPAGDGG